MLLPEIYALYVSNPTLSRTSLATLSGGVLALQLGLVLVAKKRFEQTVTQVDQYTYLISSAFVLFLSFFAGPWITVAITAGVVASYMLLAHVQGTKTWHLVAGYMALVPLLWGGKSVGVLLTANIGALLVNIYFALRYRLEVNRWISTGLWLLIPVSLGAGLLGSFSPAVYAWSYIVIMLGLIFSRAIARGSAFLSSKVPLASYISSKSSSYVVGYWLAAVVALYTSLYSANDRLQTSLILAVLTAFAVFISQKIEKNDDLMALVPLLLQTLLLSVWRPTNNNQITSYLLVSSMLTLVTYFAVAQEKNGRKVQSALQLASLVTVWIAPVSFLFIGHTLITMPLGFFVAALLNLQASKHITQEVKEAWQSVATLALMWLIYFAGVRVFQVYVHVLVAMFAVFAYIRHQRNEITQSNSYIYAMLATATVTLAVQALGGYAGGLYGWWLLLEEVAFMIMGMSLGKKFVTQWGLYVSVAAVLYQLRGLGWAALSFLALFLIGLAVYKIQKSNQ